MSDFPGFKSLSANFTPTPNQFFDKIVGHYQPCVVAVVAILIRSTLGWEDADTGERRVEAELAMPAFIRPELSEQSVRRGLAGAIEAGFIVKTAPATPREPARYALRWSDPDAQERAILKQRAADGVVLDNSDVRDTNLEPLSNRGTNLRPLNLRPAKESPPYIVLKKLSDSEKEKSPEKQTLNVGGNVNFVAEEGKTGVFSSAREAEVQALVSELQDIGSEKRHRQLLAICDDKDLSSLPRRALQATRERMAKEGKRGLVQRPGAYYQRILISLLEDHQVFVPKIGDETPEEVKRQIDASMGLSSVVLKAGDDQDDVGE